MLAILKALVLLPLVANTWAAPPGDLDAHSLVARANPGDKDLLQSCPGAKGVYHLFSLERAYAEYHGASGSKLKRADRCTMVMHAASIFS